MSRAKLLRQYLTDYNRKVGKADDIYKEQYGVYAGKVNEYNAFVESVRTGGARAIGEIEPGAYTMLQGYENGSIGPSDTDKGSGNAQYVGPLVDALPENKDQSQKAVYLKNPDGTATYHTWDNPASKLVYDTENPVIFDPYDPANQPKWVNAGRTARLMIDNTGAPPEQNAPPPPRFTQRDIREMENPTNDAAGIAKANALGYSGNPQLKADQGSSSNSAFINIGGDDPNNLKSKGVLARAVAGEI